VQGSGVVLQRCAHLTAAGEQRSRVGPVVVP
jgi:hypothetical protein